MSNTPFVGLRPFKREEASIFFGREEHVVEFFSQFVGLSPLKPEETAITFGKEAHIAECLPPINEQRFMTLVGHAGSGKTSFINAGLIPHLLNDEHGAAVKWQIAEMQPGAHPFANLVAALRAEQALNTNFNAIDINASVLKSNPNALHELLAKHPLPPQTKLLVICDQFEDVFRYPNEEATAFIELLVASTKAYADSANNIYVLISLQSGCLKQCRSFPKLAVDMNNGLFLLPGLNPVQLSRAIEKPIEMFGGCIEQELCMQLLEDVAQNQLPLLQLALLSLWKKSTDQYLTIFDYYVIGGVKRVLSNHADQLFFSLTTEQQMLARTLFKALLVADQQGGYSTQPLKLMDIAALAKVDWKALVKVADAFRQDGEGFLSPTLPQILTADTYLEITHDSYCQQWHQLAEWVEEETNAAKNYVHLKDTALQYQSANGSLLRASELDVLWRWYEETEPTELWSKRYGGEFALAEVFLKKCKKIALIKKVSVLTIGLLMLAVTSLFTISFMQGEAELQSNQMKQQAVHQPVKAATIEGYNRFDDQQSTVVLYDAHQNGMGVIN